MKLYSQTKKPPQDVFTLAYVEITDQTYFNTLNSVQ